MRAQTHTHAPAVVTANVRLSRRDTSAQHTDTAKETVSAADCFCFCRTCILMHTETETYVSPSNGNCDHELLPSVTHMRVCANIWNDPSFTYRFLQDKCICRAIIRWLYNQGSATHICASNHMVTHPPPTTPRGTEICATH